MSQTAILKSTVTTFVSSGRGKQLTSRRVLVHFPERMAGYDASDRDNVIQTRLAPVSVALCPTTTCVRQCSFCSNTTRNKNGQKVCAEYNPETLKQVSDDLKGMGVLGVTIAGGGEPLVYDKPAFYSFLAQARPPFKIGIHTNGVLLQKLFTKPIMDSGNIRYINVSAVAHRPDLYQQVTGSPHEQFFKIEQGLKRAVELQKSRNAFAEFGVKIILCRSNYRHVKGMVDYFRGLGIKNVLLRCVGNFEQDQDVELREEQYQELATIFRGELGMSEDQISAVTGRNPVKPPIPSRCWMTALQFNAGIYPDGEVYICTLWAQKEFSIGNVNKQRFSSLWGGEKHKEVARALNRKLQDGICDPLRCRLYYSNLLVDKYVEGARELVPPKSGMDDCYGRFI